MEVATPAPSERSARTAQVLREAMNDPDAQVRLAAGEGLARTLAQRVWASVNAQQLRDYLEIIATGLGDVSRLRVAIDPDISLENIKKLAAQNVTNMKAVRSLTAMPSRRSLYPVRITAATVADVIRWDKGSPVQRSFEDWLHEMAPLLRPELPLFHVEFVPQGAATGSPSRGWTLETSTGTGEAGRCSPRTGPLS